jgi:hypothetical protein
VSDGETTDPFEDALEAELRSFRPVAPSRAAADSIARELARDGPVRHRLRWFIGPAAAAAACVVAGVVLWRVTHPLDVQRPVRMASTTTTVSPPSVPNDRDEDRPSLSNYRRALAVSPAAVDELLDRHAARLLPPDSGELTAAARVGVSAGLDSLR